MKTKFRKTTEFNMKATPPLGSAALSDAFPLREAFLKRSLDTITRIAAQADPKLLAEALSAATGVGSLARVLGDTGAVGDAVTALDPLAPLAARNAEHRIETLAAAGGALSSTEVSQRLGVSRQAIDKRRRAHALLAVRVGGDWRYPACQFDEDDGEVVRDLPKLLDGFRPTPPWVVLDFLLAPEDILGGETPLQSLRRAGMTPALERLIRIERGDGFA